MFYFISLSTAVTVNDRYIYMLTYLITDLVYFSDVYYLTSIKFIAILLYYLSCLSEAVLVIAIF